jgi:hypothetical protein
MISKQANPKLPTNDAFIASPPKAAIAAQPATMPVSSPAALTHINDGHAKE